MSCFSMSNFKLKFKISSILICVSVFSLSFESNTLRSHFEVFSMVKLLYSHKN